MKIRSLCNKSLLALAVGGLLSFGASANEDKMQKMDTNNDGRISAAEHAAGARTMFQKMDANSDGRVTAAEMDANQQMKTDKSGKSTTTAAEKIKVVDSNGDGVLTAAEHEQASKTKFSQMDTDGDGYLSAAEMQSGHDRMMNDRAPAPTR